jgi:hypothetical protein
MQQVLHMQLSAVDVVGNESQQTVHHLKSLANWETRISSNQQSLSLSQCL